MGLSTVTKNTLHLLNMCELCSLSVHKNIKISHHFVMPVSQPLEEKGNENLFLCDKQHCFDPTNVTGLKRAQKEKATCPAEITTKQNKNLCCKADCYLPSNGRSKPPGPLRIHELGKEHFAGVPGAERTQSSLH